MTHLRPVGSGVPSDDEATGVGAADPSDLTDLLRRSGRADEAAFAQLYDATSRRVYGMALRVVRDPAQAEEVTQEAFLEIWRTASRFDADRGSPLSWLLTIAHRKAVDRVRSAEAQRAATRRTTSATTRSTTTPPPRPSRPRSRLAASAAPCRPSPKSSARPSASRTSVATPTRRWRPCSTYRSAPPRPASETDSSGCATPWESDHDHAERHPRSLRRLRRRRTRRHRARRLRAAPRRVRRLPGRGRQPPRGGARCSPRTPRPTPPAELRDRVLAGIKTVRPLPPETTPTGPAADTVGFALAVAGRRGRGDRRDRRRCGAVARSPGTTTPRPPSRPPTPCWLPPTRAAPRSTSTAGRGPR